MADTLRDQQFALSNHLRDPHAHPAPPGIEERRLAIYRDLFFNNIEGLLAGNFRVDRITVADTRGQFAEVENLALDWTPFSLLTARFDAEQFSASRIASTATGLSWSAGMEPAERTSTASPARWRR